MRDPNVFLLDVAWKLLVCWHVDSNEAGGDAEVSFVEKRWMQHMGNANRGGRP